MADEVQQPGGRGVPDHPVEGVTRIEQSIVQQVESRGGPLPDPESLRVYKDIQADYPERILRMAEIEQEHRHKTEREVLAAEISDKIDERRETKRGQLCGLAAVALVIATAITCYVILPGAAGAVVASILGTGTLGGLVTAFVWARKDRHDPQLLSEMVQLRRDLAELKQGMKRSGRAPAGQQQAD